MTLVAVLRDTGSALLRAPLLWLFAAAGVAATELGSWDGTSTGMLLLSLLLFPVAVLAEAAQVRAVELHRASRRGGAMTVARALARDVLPLIAINLTGTLLLLLFAPLGAAARSLFPALPEPQLTFLATAVIALLPGVWVKLAVCGVVIDRLSLAGALASPFRLLRHGSGTLLAVVLLCGVAAAVGALTARPLLVAADARLLAGAWLTLLVLEAARTALLASSYLYLAPVAGAPTRAAAPPPSQPVAAATAPAGDHRRATPLPVAFARALTGGPAAVRDELARHHVAGASLAASRFSLSWLLALIAGSLAISCFLPVLIAAPAPAAADTLSILLAIPLGAAAVVTVVSAFAATGLAISAFFTGTEQRSRAVLALLLSAALAIACAVLAIGVIGLAG